MAQIIKKGPSWMVRVSIMGDDGKQHKKSKAGFKTKAAAKAYAAKMEFQKATGGVALVSGTMFPDYFKDWFNLYKRSNVTERTALTYHQVYNALKQYLNVPLEDIDRRRYRQFMVDFGSNRAKSTVSKFNSLIHACVKDAMYDGVVHKDFVASTNLVFDKSKTREVDYLSIDEIQKLVSHLVKTRNVHFTSKYMILTAIYTGARLGEIQALTWGDIKNNTISINKSWNETTQDFQPTKNESSIRTINVDDQLIALLKELNFNKKQIFVSQYHTVPTSAAVNKTLRESLKACHINRRGFHFHSLRHSHVAFLLANGIDLYAISKRLGHSDITTTSRVYSYMIDEYKNLTNNQIIKALGKLSSV